MAGKRRDDNTGLSDSQEQQDSQGDTGRPLSGRPSQWDLNFDDFVVWAHGEDELETDNRDTGWRSPLWEFTRLIKGWFKEGIKAEAAFKKCNDAVKRRLGGWEKFDLDYDSAYAEFVTAWKKIRWRADESPLQQALLKAERHPVKAPKKDGESRPTPGYDRFISLVGWLQFTVGDRPIFLPVRQIAEALKTDIRMISLWRQMAVDDGVIEVTTAHEYKPGKKGKATEFRVTAGFVSWFKDHMTARMT